MWWDYGIFAIFNLYFPPQISINFFLILRNQEIWLIINHIAIKLRQAKQSPIL